jgi:geranylgeranyl reductase family protein
MTNAREKDIVVVGGGTSGAFAAGTAADKGLDVALLERKSSKEAGQIACGDAIHNPTDKEVFPGPFDMDEVASNPDLSVNNDIRRGLYWDEDLGVEKEIPFDEPGNVVDRYVWGQELLDQAEKHGADLNFNTVVNEIIQGDKVKGVKAVEDGEPVTYEADLVIDAGGALSSVMDHVDFDGTDFEKPNYDQFGSAYREIVELEKPLGEFENVDDYSDALVVKPTDQFGYLWFFPKNPTEINVGLGFQMNREPIKMVDVVKEELQSRKEFENATLKERLGSEDKLGAAIGLRRPLDSAVAPGYIAVGDAAGMVSPTTGKGITGAAISGYSAGKHGAEAVMDGDVSEEGLWAHNHYIFAEHEEGRKLVKQDVANIGGEAYNLDTLRGAVSMAPVQSLMDSINGTNDSNSVLGLLRAAKDFGWENINHFLGESFEGLDATQKESNKVAFDMYKAMKKADELGEHYSNFPESPEGFDEWYDERNQLDTEIARIVDSNWDKYGTVDFEQY